MGGKLILELEPLKGFGPIRLGSSREEVLAAMATLGFPLETSQADMDRFCESSIQTEYQDGRVTFIGVFHSEAYIARYRGVDVFDVTARELFQIAAAADNSGPSRVRPARILLSQPDSYALERRTAIRLSAPRREASLGAGWAGKCSLSIRDQSARGRCLTAHHQPTPFVLRCALCATR